MAEPDTTLETLGWNESLEKSFAPRRQLGFEPGRVAVEDKHHYVVLTGKGALTGKVAGRFLHQARTPADLPKVGDWVAFTVVAREDKAIIHQVLPRRTKLSRKITGRETEEQVLVANVEIAFLVQALDASFNPGLLQRHLVMVAEGGVKPVVVLNKADICDDILAKLATVERIARQVPVIAVSARTGQAMDSLTQLIRPGETIAFIGASGVGKSSLINHLYGEEIQATMEVRERDAKGRHTTTWRELIVLPKGGLVIDTPGMRELQMWLAGQAGREAFADIEELALKCHFRNCSHMAETRCAVREALKQGALPRERYESYLKLKRELDYLSQAAHGRDRSERKRQSRLFKRGRDQSNRRREEEQS
jgi:ribosome biogenesis GTPase / thiamine phosphate phosphatase